MKSHSVHNILNVLQGANLEREELIIVAGIQVRGKVPISGIKLRDLKGM